MHHLLKNSIARVLNARDGIHATVEAVLHDGSQIIPDVTVRFDDGQVVYVEVVVFHRPEFSVVPVFAPNLIVVRAIDFVFDWIHQTDDVAIAVADALERLHAALTATTSGTVQPSEVVSESWAKWGRGFRRDGFAVPQFLDVIGHGSFSTVTKFGIVGHEMVEEKIDE